MMDAKQPLRSIFVPVLITVATAGCGQVVQSAIDSAGRTAGERAGGAAGASAGAAMADAWGPGMTRYYTRYLFRLAFMPTAWGLDERSYEPGEWTQWRMSGDDGDGSTTVLERALLQRASDGDEWWRVKYVVPADDPAAGGSEETITYEGLFDGESGELLRLRGLMPGQTTAQEIPVEDGLYSPAERRRLTEESVEGARVGVETVTVEAGTFTGVDHLRFGDVSGTVHFWLSDDVPGNLVRYTASGAQAAADPSGGGETPEASTLELIDFGGGATSELGVP